MIDMYIKFIILGCVQGLTEFFPVSSSGHLVLLQNILGLKDMIVFDIFMHLASFLAIVVVFNKQILAIDLKFLAKLLLAMIPTGLVYLVFKKTIGDLFESIDWIWLFFMLSGLFIYFTRNTVSQKKKVSFWDALFIGFFQGLALIPGLSRSGLTVSSALYRKLAQDKAILFSFLLGLVAIGAATIIKAPDIMKEGLNLNGPVIVAFIVSFITSLIALKFVIKIISASKFYRFAYYCWFISIFSLGVKFLR
jgi:undecaprenyl-diphosphatase